MSKDKSIQEAISEITEQIKKGYNPEKVILFGSYAYGNPDSDSDIDLLIIKETEENRIKRFVRVKKLAYNPSRKISFSPLVYTPEEITQRLSLGDDFIEEILEKGEVLYVK